MTNIYIESFLLQKYFTVDLSQKAGKWYKKYFNRHYFIDSPSNLWQIGKVKLLAQSQTAGRYEDPPSSLLCPLEALQSLPPLPGSSPLPLSSGGCLRIHTPCPEATVGAIASIMRPKSCSGVYHIMSSGQLLAPRLPTPASAALASFARAISSGAAFLS